MATLNWIGKDAVVNHDKEVPFKLLEKVPSASVGKESKNLVIQGDNLEALKALMPFYKGKVRFIYIDPPYNTGTEKWIYNDKVNSPKIKEWLGKTVGPQSEDLTRHDKWLCMMYPRLKLLHGLLSDDGIIFISIDENENHNLRIVMDEIFGEANFIEDIVWNKRIPKNDKGIGNIHEYILLYAKNASLKHRFSMPKEGLDDVYDFVNNLKKKQVPIPEAETELKRFYAKKGYDRGITLYCNLDDDYRIWGKINVSWPNAKTGPRYDVLHPLTKKPTRVPENGWRYKEESFKKMLGTSVVKRYDGSFVCGKIWFAQNEKTQPSTIQFLDDVKDFLFRSIISIKSSGNEELAEYVPGGVFPHPKTYHLIKQLLQTVDAKDFLVLDSFAGSGTTGQAVMDLNKDDSGSRNFILVEMEESVAKNVTAKRLKVAIEKNSYEDGFEFSKLEKALFNAKGQINEACTYDELATYVYFTETRKNINRKAMEGSFIGESAGTSYYLLYTEKNKNDLTRSTLSKLKVDGTAVVYADRCLVDEDELQAKGITFKQIPYEIKVY